MKALAFLLLLPALAQAAPPDAVPWGVRMSQNMPANTEYSGHLYPWMQYSIDPSDVVLPWTVPNGWCLAVTAGHLASKLREGRASYCTLFDVTSVSSTSSGVSFEPPKFISGGHVMWDIHLTNNDLDWNQTMICTWRGWLYPDGGRACHEAWSAP